MNRFPTRRRVLEAIVLGTLAVGALHGCSADAEVDGRRPNVVIVFLDDLGYGDLGCFGNQRIPTPHVDSLAAGGARCTMSYVTNPPCSPSRCSLLTGMYAQRFGKSGMARGLPIPEDHPTLAELLRDAGYVTGQVGKWDVGSREQGPHRRGFTEVARHAPGKQYDREREDGTPVYLTDLEAEYLVEFVARNADRPFFLYWSPFAVHSKVESTPRRYRERIPGGSGTAYEGAVVAVDDAVGALLGALKAHGLEEDTLVLLASDNGANQAEGGSSTPYRGGKGPGTQLEGWVHVPTLASWPGTIPAGRVYTGLMATFDLYATAAAVAGASLPERCDGEDLLPWLAAERDDDVHEFLFWHNVDPTDAPRRNLRAVRWKHWRLVALEGEWRLFDLLNDPEERDPVGMRPQVYATMLGRYEEFVATLPPVKPSGDYEGGGRVPRGWGWVVGDGRTPAAGSDDD